MAEKLESGVARPESSLSLDMRGGCLIKGPTPSPATLLSQNLNVQQVFWPVFTLSNSSLLEHRFFDRQFYRYFLTIQPGQEVRRLHGIRKMAKSILRLLVIAVVLNVAACQTFQYSRGWTNGKRSNDFATLPLSKLLDLPTHNIDLRMAETLSTFCCEKSCSTRKAVVLLKNNGKSQLYLVPCELLRDRRRNMNEEKVQDIVPADGHFRRSLSNEYDSNNDNY